MPGRTSSLVPVRLQRLLLAAAAAAAVAAAIRCAPPPTTDTVLECSGPDIHHILRIHATDGRVEDVSGQMHREGEAEIDGGAYLLRFVDPGDHYETVFQIDRASGTGTRALFDDEQQAVKGRGGFDEVRCRPYGGTA